MLSLSVAKCLFKVNKKGTKKTTIGVFKCFHCRLWTSIFQMYGKGKKNDKSNYQPVRLLLILSKVYEKCLYKQLEICIENILSNFQCGFKKGFNAQQCLVDIIKKVWQWVKSVRIRIYSGPHFPTFGLDTGVYGISLCI